MRQHFGRDAYARIANFDHHHLRCLIRHHLGSLLRLDAEPDAPAFVGVLGGVGEQVHQHLLQPGGVCMQEDGLWRQRYLELMPVLPDQRLGRLHCPFNYVAQVNLLLAKPDTAGGDARDLKKVVHQMFKLSNLALDDAPALLERRVFVHLHAQKLRSVGEGRQRIAQLMAEHGQKLVLAPVLLGQGLGLYQRFSLQLLAFGDVNPEADRAPGDAVLEEHAPDVRDPAHGTIAPHDALLHCDLSVASGVAGVLESGQTLSLIIQVKVRHDLLVAQRRIALIPQHLL